MFDKSLFSAGINMELEKIWKLHKSGVKPAETPLS